MQSTLLSEPNDATWTQIAPLLDDAMSGLGETDRAALVLRFFENKTTREIADALKLNEAAAQKRVTRALEKLREMLAQRGIKTTAATLSVVITAHAVQAVPVGMAATITAAATIAGTTLVTTTIATATKTIAMTTLQKTIVAATVAALAGAGIYEARQATNARAEVQTLQQQVEQNQQLQKERDDATNRLALMAEEITRLKSNPNQNELLKLRGEVTRLKQVTAKSPEIDSRESLMKSWLAREDRLKQIVEQFPDKKIPDLQLVSEEDWLTQARDAKFDTDSDVQRTLANLRNAAAHNFSYIASDAVKKYMEANNNQFPTDLAQLQPYFKTPVSDDILNRWGIMPQSEFPNQKMGGDWVIAVKNPVNRGLDSSIVIGPGSYGSSDYQSVDTQKAITILEPALKAYAAAHNGSQAGTPAEIQPFLTTPEQQAAFQTLMQKSLKKE